MSNLDSKGVKRGACTSPGCDGCDIFIWDKDRSNSHTCSYCGCFAAKHAKLAEATILPENEPSVSKIYEIDSSGVLVELNSNINHTLETSSTSMILTPEVTHQRLDSSSNDIRSNESSSTARGSTAVISLPKTNEKNDVPSNSNVTNLALEKLTKNDRYELCVPCVLPFDCSKALKENKKLEATQRQFLLRWIALTMQNFQLGSDQDFVEVATRLIEKYPAMQNPANKGPMGIILNMKKILSNRKYYSAKVATAKKRDYSTNSKNSLNDIMDAMKNEMGKTSPSVAVLKSLLTDCRAQRLDMSKKESAKEHLRNFPALKLKNLVFWEFCHQISINETEGDLKMKWCQYIPKMFDYFLKKDFELNKYSSDVLTINLLQEITGHFTTIKKRDIQLRCHQLIEVFEEGTDIESTLPDMDDPPRLICIGDKSKENMSASIYVDGTAISTGNVTDALVHLLAVYWVFNIEPAKAVSAAFSFICGVIIRDEAKSRFKKYKKVMNALERIGCY